MSSASQSAGAPAGGASSGSASSGGAGKRRPRGRLWRWTRRLALLLVLLVVALRIALPLVLPGVLRDLGEARGLSIEYEDLDLALLAGEVRLTHLDVRPLDAAAPAGEVPQVGDPAATPTDAPAPPEPLLHVDYVDLDVDMTALLRGKLRVRRAVVDGVALRLERDADGEFELARHLATAETESGAPARDEAPARETAAKAQPEEARAFDFTPPFELVAARLQHVELHLVDRSAATPLDARILVDVRLSDLGGGRPARLDVDARSETLLDRLRIEGEFLGALRSLDADLDVRVDGLRPRPLAGFLAAAGLEPLAAELDATLRLVADCQALEESEQAASAHITLTDVALRADTEEALALDSLEIRVPRFSTGRLEVEAVEVSGIRGRARRLADGALAAAGFALRPVAGEADGEPDAGPVPTEGDPAPDGAGAAQPVLELATLRITGVELRWEDAAVSPEVDLTARLDVLELLGLVRDDARPDAEVTLRATGAVTGVAGALDLELRARPFAQRVTAALTYTAEDLDGASVAPYLAAAGLAPDLGSGRASGALEAWLETDEDGALSAGLEARDLRLDPGDGRPELGFARIALDRLDVTADATTVRVGELLIEGPRVEVARDVEGVTRFLGLRTLTAAELAALPAPRRTAGPAPAIDPDGGAGAAPGSTAADGPPPRLEVARAALRGAVLRYTDASTSPPVDLRLDDLVLTLTDLGLGGPRTGGPPDRARLEASLAAEGLARRLELSGTIDSRPGPLDFDVSLTLDGEGLVTDLIDPLLDQAGIESLLEDGRLAGDLTASVRDTEEGLRVALRATDLAWSDGATELLALDLLSLDDLLLGATATRMGTVELAGARLAAARDAGGGLRALGFRLRPAPAAPGAGPTRATAPGPAGPGAPVQEPAPGEAGGAFSLARAALDGVALTWRDEAFADPVATRLVVSGSLADLHVGEPGPPATFALDAALEGALDSLRLEGSLSLGEERVLDLQLRGAGLRAGPLAAYVPAGVEVVLTDGRLSGDLALREGPAAEGGRSLSVDVLDLDLRDGADGAPLAALERLRLLAPRLDAAGGVYRIEELTTEGLVLDVARTGPERIEGLGVALALGGPGPPDAAPETGAGAPAPRAQEPSAQEPGAPGAAIDDEPDPSPVRTLIVGISGVAPDSLPTVDIDRLSLGVDRFRFVDRTAPEAIPLDLRAHLTLPAPTRLLGPEPEDLPPIVLELAGAAPPFVGESLVRLEAAPFAVTPTLILTLDVGGLRGDGLLEVLPDLAERLDASALEDGRLTGRLELELDAQRRGAAAFDLSRGLGVVLSIDDVAFRATPEGEVLLGVERVYVEAPRLRPATGDLDIRTVEITRPRGRARRTPEGLEVLGLLLRNAPPGAGGNGAPGAAQGAAGAAAQGPPPAATPPVDPADGDAPGPVLTVRELLVNGADLRYVDDSVQPSLVVPITDVDLELKGLSTDPQAGAATLRLYLESGRVALPERSPGDSLVSGLLGAAAGIVTGSSRTYDTEERPLWESALVTGRLDASSGKPTGYVTVDLQGFELPALRGIAKGSGVDIGDGLVDTRTTLRLLGERGLRLDTRTTFSKLFVSEPPGGPISKYLALPAPLDTVLYVLRDESEQQVIPLSISIPPDGISTATILGAVTKTLGQLIAEAVASSPLRIGAGIVGALGLLPEEEVTPAGPPLPVRFAALDSVVGPGAVVALQQVARDVRRVRGRTVVLTHTVGGADVALTARITELDEGSVRELGGLLRTTRDTLAAQRDALAASVRGHLAVGRLSAAEEQRVLLVQVDQRILETEEALDQVFGLLRPGAGRSGERRSRAMATVIGEARIQAVRQVLIDAGLPQGRIETRRPRASAPRGSGGGEVVVTPR